MPVNSFDDYPMSWKPDKSKLTKPLYKSIAKYLEQDIKSGVLRARDKLPPQRELADFLDINLSTVTRAYKICELKGLIYGTIGKGSFVSANASSPVTALDNTGSALIEMGTILPFAEHDYLIRAIAADILDRPNSESYFDYRNPSGSISQLQTAKKWLNKFQVDAKEENIIIAAGAQNALAITLASLFKPGDKIATNAYTYANFISLANMLSIQLMPVDGDEFGMLPDRLDCVCGNNQIQGIYLIPSCDNPNNSVMGDIRRQDVANVIKKHRLILIEDDIYAFLSPERFKPFFSLVPEQTVYISGASKPICAGVRVAYITFPGAFQHELRQGLYNLNLKTPSFNIEIVTEIIHRNLDENLVNWKRALAAERNELFLKYFDSYPVAYHRTSYYQWLLLPGNCSGRSFELQAAGNGVKVYGAERFAVGGLIHTHAVRIATCSPRDTRELEKGLDIIKRIYDRHTEASSSAQPII